MRLTYIYLEIDFGSDKKSKISFPDKHKSQNNSTNCRAENDCTVQKLDSDKIYKYAIK